MDSDDENEELLNRVAELESRLEELEARVGELEAGDIPTPQRDTSVPIPAPAAKPFEVVAIDAKITEANTVWSKFAWKLTVKNLTMNPMVLAANIEFLDKDGFVVDEDTESNLLLQAGAQNVYTGYKLITAAVVGSVNSISAKVVAR